MSYIFTDLRASYRDGMMEYEPKACAAVKGTQIMVWIYLWHFLNRLACLF